MKSAAVKDKGTRKAAQETVEAVPFLKWIGGKRNLLAPFASLFPAALEAGEIHTYCEPFLGGGAVFLSLASRYQFEHIYLTDINPDLVLTYQVVRDDCAALIDQLTTLQEAYFGQTQEAQELLYKDTRTAFNELRMARHASGVAIAPGVRVLHAARFMFLNKAGYGGMFRVNKRGGFNVPFGKHKRPQIVHPVNLKRASAVLANAHIAEASFTALPDHLGPGCFVYFDPPYRPVSATASFTSYHGSGFNDDDQAELASLYRDLDRAGVHLMLSNSDPMSETPSDPFFEELYAGYKFHRVGALRKINSNFNRRGRKAELVITNDPHNANCAQDPKDANALGEAAQMEQLSWL